MKVQKEARSHLITDLSLWHIVLKEDIQLILQVLEGHVRNAMECSLVQWPALTMAEFTGLCSVQAHSKASLAYMG